MMTALTLSTRGGLFALLILGLLQACTSLPSGGDKPTPLQERPLDDQLAYWLERSETSVDARFKAASLYVALGNNEAARDMLDGVEPDTSQPDYRIARAALLLDEQRYQQALKMATPAAAADKPASDDQRYRLAILRAKAYGGMDKPLASARQRTIAGSLGASAVKDSRQRINNNAIWNSLGLVASKDIESQLKVLENNRYNDEQAVSDWRGWLSLMLSQRQHAGDIFLQQSQLSQWRQQWPGHPANRILPETLASLERMQRSELQHVTLLLPLSGKLAAPGKAIRDGFLAAFYAGSKADNVQLRVVDSVSSDFNALYRSIAESGTNMIVGPLRKENVVRLTPLGELNVPTLALNYIETEQATAFYQFGLAAEDDARQVAEGASSQGHRNAMVIAPEGIWGDRVIQAFSDHWQALDGKIVEEMRIRTPDEMSPLIKRSLQLRKSDGRRKRLETLLEVPLEFTPRRRKDIDMIFVALQPKLGRALKPVLAFHYADEIPVYGTSHIFSGKVDATLDADLDGITYTELPWLLNADNLLRITLENSRQYNSRLARMYALGADARKLVAALQQMNNDPQTQISGSTGRLFLLDDRRIHRAPDWAQFRNGKPVAIPALETNDSADSLLESSARGSY